MGIAPLAPDDLVKIPLGTTYEWRPEAYQATGLSEPPSAAALSLPEGVRKFLQEVLQIILNHAQKAFLSPLEKLELDAELHTLLPQLTSLLKAVGEILMQYLRPEDIERDMASAYVRIQKTILDRVPSALDLETAVSLQAMVDGYLEIFFGALRRLSQGPLPPVFLRSEDLDRHFLKLALSTTIALACVFGLLRDFQHAKLSAIIDWGEDALGPAMRIAYKLEITDGRRLEAAIPGLREGVWRVLDEVSRDLA